MENKKKTVIEEMDRGIYDVKNEDTLVLNLIKDLLKKS